MPPVTKKFLIENLRKLIVLTESAGNGMEHEALDANNPMMLSYAAALKNQGQVLRSLLNGHVVLSYKEWEKKTQREQDNTEVV